MHLGVNGSGLLHGVVLSLEETREDICGGTFFCVYGRLHTFLAVSKTAPKSPFLTASLQCRGSLGDRLGR